MIAKQYGPWALIVGGSEGVGASFAFKLAAEGLNLALIARKPGPLAELAAAVKSRSKVDVRTLSMDIRAADMLDRVRRLTDDIEVGLLIYNAGAVTRFSQFLDASLEDALDMVRLNALGQAILAHHFGSRMRPRGRGGIILVGSMAGYAGAPGEICYAASKAFSRIFAEGLWHELKPHGVHVLGLTLGLTRTPSMARLGMAMDNPDFVPAEPDDVAQAGLDNLANGPLFTIGGEEGAKYLSTLPRAQAVEFMAQGAKSLHG
ncbi:MAG TPA: SDR family NAD(P)-dependent oxidoreductase [Alphaproteobacteria bacterium]|nr:SDR family NAD(P)-dependent oxidoreductase [Alphaproteobacteria bacterium]